VELSAPLTVNWTLSYDCNFSCKHCYSRDLQRRNLPLEDVLRVIAELARCRVAFVSFGGGEPLVYPHLFQVARAAADQGLRVAMNTNGWLLDSQTAERIRHAGFSSVGVSLDGATPEVHDTFRNRRGSFARALEALENLHRAGVQTTVSAVIFRANVQSYRELVRIAADRGASTVYLHNFKCAGRGMDNRADLDLSPDEWRRFYEHALAYRSQAPAGLAFDDPILALLGASEPGAVKGSTCGKLSLHLEPDGDVTPCGFIPLSAGNILSEGLASIWKHSPVLQQMRGKTPQGKCRTCSAYGECLGGCTARAFAMTGTFDAPDPHCWREPDAESTDSAAGV
jgi:GeoRSP system radical SAM/SPASM protein